MSYPSSQGRRGYGSSDGMSMDMGMGTVMNLRWHVGILRRFLNGYADYAETC